MSETKQATALRPMTRKRYCHSPVCDVKTIHVATFNDDGLYIWKCDNCGKETRRKVVPSPDESAEGEE